MNSMTATVDKSGASRGRWSKLIVFACVILVVAGASLFLPVKDYVQSALEWVRELGFWGTFFVAAFYVLACVLLLPGGVLTMGAGFLFGVVTGTVTVSIGSTLGACAAFMVGRWLVRDWVQGKVAGNPKFAAIDRAVGEQGFKIVLLTRLSPIFPFNLLNYAYGLTGVKLWKYALASWVGMLPGTVAYVYIGSGLRSLTDVVSGGQKPGGWTGQAMFWGGLAAAVVVMVVVARVASRAMKQAIQETNQPEPKET